MSKFLDFLKWPRHPYTQRSCDPNAIADKKECLTVEMLVEASKLMQQKSEHKRCECKFEYTTTMNK